MFIEPCVEKLYSQNNDSVVDGRANYHLEFLYFADAFSLQSKIYHQIMHKDDGHKQCNFDLGIIDAWQLRYHYYKVLENME